MRSSMGIRPVEPESGSAKASDLRGYWSLLHELWAAVTSTCETSRRPPNDEMGDSLENWSQKVRFRKGMASAFDEGERTRPRAVDAKESHVGALAEGSVLTRCFAEDVGGS